ALQSGFRLLPSWDSASLFDGIGHYRGSAACRAVSLGLTAAAQSHVSGDRFSMKPDWPPATAHPPTAAHYPCVVPPSGGSASERPRSIRGSLNLEPKVPPPRTV